MFQFPSFAVVSLLVALSQNTKVHAIDNRVDGTLLRGGQFHGSRTLIDVYKCDLCKDPNNQFQSVPSQLSGMTVTLTNLGAHHCKGLYDAALAGGIVSGQNECNAVKAEFGPVCCNGNTGGVDGDPLTTTDAPGSVGTLAPTASPPISTPPPTLVDFGSSCAAVTNSTSSCGSGDRGNGLCSNGSCCSQYGWCGMSPEYCNTDPLYLSGAGTTSTNPPESINATIQSTAESP